MLGLDFQNDRPGLGLIVPEALRDLAAQLEKRNILVWVRRRAKQYLEDGVLKAACPECGDVTQLTDFDRVIAFVCEECGAGVNVEDEGGRKVAFIGSAERSL